MRLLVVLYQPEIPPNTGNVIRLCANTGAELHLVEPLGFTLDDRRLRRAGLDYREYCDIRVHADFATFLGSQRPARVFCFTTRGKRGYTDVAYAPGDALVFGPETRGLPDEMLSGVAAENRLRIPMRAGVRSLNLSNSVAVAVYEVRRQQGFPGAG